LPAKNAFPLGCERDVVAPHGGTRALVRRLRGSVTRGYPGNMIWRTGEHLLVAVDGTFVVIDPTGAVTQRYGSRTYSDEDDLWIWDQFVAGGRLYERTRIERYCQETRRDLEVVLEGLAPDDDPATRARVAAALSADAVLCDEARARKQRAGQARVAAITGADQAYDLGDEFAHAWQALSARVRAYDHPHDHQIAADPGAR